MKTVYKNWQAAIGSGILLALGWPTYGEPLLLFAAFVPLLFAERRIRLSGKKRRGLKAFGTAYLAFLIWNVWATWWLWNSTAAGAVFTLLANSLLMALVFLAYHVVARYHNERLSFIFLVGAFVGFEKFHFNWELSWPWLNLGNAFSERVSWVQWYEYTGILGGTVWIWAVNIFIYSFIIKHEKQKPMRRFIAPFLVKSFFLIALPIGASLILYHTYQETENPIRIGLLQPNIDPYSEKFNMSNKATLDTLSGIWKENLTDIDLLIAPETVFPEYINVKDIDKSDLVRRLSLRLSAYPNLSFQGGFLGYEEKTSPDRYSSKLDNGQYINIYNAAFMLNPGAPVQLYYKSKPVAGVEIFPYKSILQPLLGNLMIDLGGISSDITPQEERAVFYSRAKDVSTAPIICYESVFGEFVTDYVRKGAQILTVMTNDAWWGNTQGHKQLLSYARLRTIETRRSMARSANTGISAFINQRGDVLSSLEYGKKGMLKGTIHKNDIQTFYVKYGDWIARAAIFAMILIVLLIFPKRFSRC